MLWSRASVCIAWLPNFEYLQWVVATDMFQVWVAFSTVPCHGGVGWRLQFVAAVASLIGRHRAGSFGR